MKKNKILIVDDNKLNRQSLADIFRKAYQIVESEDGKKALEYLKKDTVGSGNYTGSYYACNGWICFPGGIQKTQRI